jgi:hypothetical protein
MTHLYKTLPNTSYLVRTAHSGTLHMIYLFFVTQFYKRESMVFVSVYLLEGQTTQWPSKKDKRTNNNLQNITHKTTDRVTRTPLKTEGELTCSYIYVYNLDIQMINYLYDLDIQMIHDLMT